MLKSNMNDLLTADVFRSWVNCRQNIVSYLRNTPIHRRRSHSRKTRRRYNRELCIRYNNF